MLYVYSVSDSRTYKLSQHSDFSSIVNETDVLVTRGSMNATLLHVKCSYEMVFFSPLPASRLYSPRRVRIR